MPTLSTYTVAAALDYKKTTPIKISDTGTKIAAKFDDLKAISTKISSITASTPLTISLDQYTKDKLIIPKITTASNVTVTNVTPSSIADILKNAKYLDNIVVTTTYSDINKTKTTINNAITAAHSVIKITGFIIKDSFANVTKNIDQINNLGAQLFNISLTDAKPSALTFKLTAGQFVKDQKVVDFILKQGPTFSVSDTASNIATNIDKLNSFASKIGGGIVITNSALPLSISASQLTKDTAALSLIKGTYSIEISDVNNPLKLTYNQLINDKSIISILNKIQSAYSLSIKDASIANITKITANKFVTYAANTDVFLVDTAEHVKSNLANLEKIFNTSNFITLKGITLTDEKAPTFSLTSSQYTDNADVLKLITSPYSLKISGVITDDLTTVLKDPHVTSIAISDTADSVSAAFDKLNANASKITDININLSDTKTPYPISLTSVQFLADNAALNLLKGAYTLDISNAPANLKTLSNYTTYATHINSFTIKDTSAKIISNLDDLNSLGAKLTDVIQTDPSNTPFEITATQFTLDMGLLNKISTNFSVNVNQVSAQNVGAILNNSAANFIINAVSVSDSNAHIKSQLILLEDNISSINAITINDNNYAMAISQDQLVDDIDVLNLLAKSNPSITFNVDLPALNSSSLVFDVDGANGHINFILHPNTTDTPADNNFGTIKHFTGQDKISFASILTSTLTTKTTGTLETGVAHINGSTGVASFSASDTSLALQINAVEKAIRQTGTTQGNVALWQNGDDSYAFISDATTGVTAGDDLIKLTGVDVSHLHVINGVISYN